MAQLPAAGGPFEALGDPNGREILRLLSDGDKPVREIADAMTISRPAVSRHLRVLKDAGMVAEQASGTRRIYHLQARGMNAVQAYLESIWGEAAVRFRLLAENLAEWTDRIGTWWPPDHTATGQADLIVLEGGVGGRIYERTSDGVEHDWGEVTVWEPPARLVYVWHLRRDREDATGGEDRFLAQGGAATRIEVRQPRREGLGRPAREVAEPKPAGLATLLPHYLA